MKFNIFGLIEIEFTLQRESTSLVTIVDAERKCVADALSSGKNYRLTPLLLHGFQHIKDSFERGKAVRAYVDEKWPGAVHVPRQDCMVFLVPKGEKE